jgi:hypothetical protein
VRLSLYAEKQLEICVLVATFRKTIVATIVPAWKFILLFKQSVKLLFNKMSIKAISFIVKPDFKVITIERHADALIVSAL